MGGLIRGAQVGFKETYPEQSSQDVSELLKGIPKNTLMIVLPGILANLFKGSKKIKDMLGIWFRAENNGFANDAFARIKPIEDETKRVILASIPSALKIYSYALNNLTEDRSLTDAQIEVNLFKAFLTQNDEINKIDEVVTKTTKGLPFEWLTTGHHFANGIRFLDVTEYDINELFISEFIRAVLFFEFLASNKEATPLLNLFCKTYDAADWKEYVQRMSGICFSIINSSKKGFVDLNVPPGENYERDCKFLDTLSAVSFDEMTDSDFKALREKPLHKISKGNYRIVFDLFCIERMFKGLYFNLKGINTLLPKAEQVKDLRTMYTYKFSEQTALYEILHRSFPKKWIQITGEQISAKKFDGGPDYYARYNNKAFVFESKDSLINSSLKESGNFTDLLQDLKIKFLEDGTKPKAVKQLLNVIVDIQTERFLKIDPSYKKEHLKIYPITVIHDRQLDIVGFNKILNIWFDEELKKTAAKIDVSKIKPITVIDATTLVLICELLNSRQLALEDVIDEYHEYVRLRKNYRSEAELLQHTKDTMLPFSFFVKDLIRHKGLKRYPQRLLKEKSFLTLRQVDEE